MQDSKNEIKMNEENSYDEENKYRTKYKLLKSNYFKLFQEYEDLGKDYKILKSKFKQVLKENK
jgi:hypothetical protein